MQFLVNPMLTVFAMSIVSGAFGDSITVGEIFSIPAPPEGEVHAIKSKDPDTLFSSVRDRRILKATSYS